MSESKNHHYVTQSLLKGFAIEGTDQIHVFDKKSGRVYKSAIWNVAAENHYNSVEIDGERVNLEHIYDSDDSDAAVVLGKLRTARSLHELSSEERSRLARAAVLQLLRVKLVRTTLASFPAQLREMFRGVGAEVAPDVAPDLSEDQIKAMSLRMIGNAGKFVPSLLDKHWILYSAPEGQVFWISDNPIVKFSHLEWGDLGLASPGVEIVWPLSSTLLLSFVCPTVISKIESKSRLAAAFLRTSPTCRANVDAVRFYNRLQVFESSRRVFASVSTFDLAREMLERIPDRREVQTTMVPSGVGKVPPSGLPAGRWLVIHGATTYYKCAYESWSVEGNRMMVKVSSESVGELQLAIADAPHDEIRLYDDEQGSRTLRLVELSRHPEDVATVIIVHDGPPL